VIVPVWREAEVLTSLIARLRSFVEVREVIVSAAEPTAGLRERVLSAGAIFCKSAEPNRGRQLNEGAKIASAEWLLFHHADTEITAHIWQHSLRLLRLMLSAADSIGNSMKGIHAFDGWKVRNVGTHGYLEQSTVIKAFLFAASTLPKWAALRRCR
jgi:glycosyltransferase involved in cell wall biosynthesis